MNLGVGDIGRLEHIKSSLEENKKLYSSDRIYVEKMIEQHIGNQEIKKEQVKDSNIDESDNMGYISKREKYEESPVMENIVDSSNENIDHKGISDAKWQMKKSLLWLGFNVLLLVGGLATLVVSEFPFIAIGVIIFCPYSIIKNLYNYFKVRKNLNEYLAQFKDS